MNPSITIQKTRRNRCAALTWALGWKVLHCIRTWNCSALCGCSNGVSKREGALRLRDFFCATLEEDDGVVRWFLQTACHRNGEWFFDRLVAMVLSADRLH
jgi:hypothetical protein